MGRQRNDRRMGNPPKGRVMIMSWKLVPAYKEWVAAGRPRKNASLDSR